MLEGHKAAGDRAKQAVTDKAPTDQRTVQNATTEDVKQDEQPKKPKQMDEDEDKKRGDASEEDREGNERRTREHEENIRQQKECEEQEHIEELEAFAYDKDKLVEEEIGRKSEEAAADEQRETAAAVKKEEDQRSGDTKATFDKKGAHTKQRGEAATNQRQTGKRKKNQDQQKLNGENSQNR